MSKESVTVAGIDCGTNSIRLKIARVDADVLHIGIAPCRTFSSSIVRISRER